MGLTEMNTTTQEYLKLVNEFPLRFIRDRETNDAALVVLASLAERENELTECEMEYFELLAELVQAYEKRVVPAVTPMAANEYLNHLMTEHNLRQVDICSQTGIPKSNLSAFLNGTRKLTKDEIGRLAVRFSVNPLAFVDDDHFGEAFKEHSEIFNQYRHALNETANQLSRPLSNPVAPKPLVSLSGILADAHIGPLSDTLAHFQTSGMPIFSLGEDATLRPARRAAADEVPKPMPESSGMAIFKAPDKDR
jgi:antitoxin component HigA of HigAB toxin-antitoxin module